MGMMIIRHKVRDYGHWRPIFDGHVEMQRAAGLINPRVYHSADSNKSEIVVVFDTEDTKKAKDFAASADLKEAMIKAGVLDTPTIYFHEERKAALAKLLRGAKLGLQLNEHISDPGDIVFRHACKLGLEGIVSKRLGSRYSSGRSRDWIKLKNPNAPAVKREAEEDWGKERWR